MTSYSFVLVLARIRDKVGSYFKSQLVVFGDLGVTVSVCSITPECLGPVLIRETKKRVLDHGGFAFQGIY